MGFDEWVKGQAKKSGGALRSAALRSVKSTFGPKVIRRASTELANLDLHQQIHDGEVDDEGIIMRIGGDPRASYNRNLIRDAFNFTDRVLAHPKKKLHEGRCKYIPAQQKIWIECRSSAEARGVFLVLVKRKDIKVHTGMSGKRVIINVAQPEEDDGK